LAGERHGEGRGEAGEGRAGREEGAGERGQYTVGEGTGGKIYQEEERMAGKTRRSAFDRNPRGTFFWIVPRAGGTLSLFSLSPMLSSSFGFVSACWIPPSFSIFLHLFRIPAALVWMGLFFEEKRRGEERR
jgi:hypothetical protein